MERQKQKMGFKGKLAAVLMSTVLLTGVMVPQITGAVGMGTTQITMIPNEAGVIINGETLTWAVAPVVENGEMYVPAKPFGDAVGVKVAWNDKTKQVEMDLPKVKVYLDNNKKLVSLNGITFPFQTIAIMKNDRLMVRLSWLADMLGAVYEQLSSGKIELLYTKLPDELIADDNDNSRPVAKFTFGKPSYRRGEPVKWIDLSYDADAEGIVKYEWTGRQEVYHEAGTYPVSLKVTDRNGHISKVYTRDLVIEDRVFATPLQYKLHYTPVGTAFKTDWKEIYASFWDLPLLKTDVTEDRSRKVLLSDSPETFTEKGILYQDRVTGKARLYADHLNGTEKKMQFIIMARNTSLTQTATIRTTNKGEVYPSIYANLIGHQASVDFLMKDKVEEKPLVLAPGQGLAYVRMPELYPGQGVNVFYDVETDGEVEFSFLAVEGNVGTPNLALLNSLKQLPFNGHVRGTFPVAEKTWRVDDLTSQLVKPSRLTIGDGKWDPFLEGYDTDPTRTTKVQHSGNYGMVYTIELVKPPKMVIMLMAKGGPFKGPFKVNGEFRMVPASGIIKAFENVHILARTTGEEERVTLEFTPPAGSAFPIDLLMFPLGELK